MTSNESCLSGNLTTPLVASERVAVSLDLDLGKSHEDSFVYESLEHYYSVEFLEEQNLWARLDQKVSEWDGCDALPNANAINPDDG